MDGVELLPVEIAEALERGAVVVTGQSAGGAGFAAGVRPAATVSWDEEAGSRREGVGLGLRGWLRCGVGWLSKVMRQSRC